MKNTLKFIMLVAAAAMAFSACNVEPIETQEETVGTHTVTFVASQLDTKTTMEINDGIASFAWEEADVNSFHIFENDYSYKATDVIGDIDENGAMQLMASFENGGTAPFTYFGFFAPTFFTYPQVPAAQTDNGKYDPMADILVAKPVTAEASQSEEILSFQFKRIVAINIMTLKGLTAGETVKNVTIDSDKPIAGKYDYTKDEWYNSTDKQITVTANSVANDKGEAVVYFVSTPVEDAQLTVTATTDASKSYSKELAKTITFKEGGVKAFGVTVASSEDVPPVEPAYVKVTSAPSDWTGRYLIVDEYIDNGITKAHVFNGVDSASDFDIATINNNAIAYNSDLKAVDIATFNDGYSIKIVNGDKSGNYISGKSGSNTIVYGTTDPVANEITYDSSNNQVTIFSNSTSLRYNAASGNDRFRYYKTTTTGNSYHLVYLYKLIGTVEDVAVTNVVLNQNEITLEVGDTETLVATVLPENATNKSVTWSSSNEEVATVKDGHVTAVGVGKATITVKTADGEFTSDCVVTVTASSTSIANTIETAYTASEAIALIDAGKDLETPVYVKGIVSEIVTAYSSSYGNISFNVSANGETTGDQFQFFRNFKGADKVKWTASEAPKVGDSVIGYGTLTKYNSTYEFAEGNYIVDIDRAKYLEASASKTSGISAAGETVTITVDTNVEGWTVISDNETFVVGEKSGNTVPVVVSANESVTDNRTANITVSAEGVEDVVITLTQDAKSDGGQGGDTKHYTAVITVANINNITGGSSTAYASFNGEHSVMATATDGTTKEMTFTSSQVMPATGSNAGKMQFQASNGTITGTDWGTIESITADSALTVTKAGDEFSVAKTTKGAGYYESITIVFSAE